MKVNNSNKTPEKTVLSSKIKKSAKKNQPCSICHQLFRVKSLRDTHEQKVHYTYDGNWACGACYGNFKHPNSLTSHLLLAHGIKGSIVETERHKLQKNYAVFIENSNDIFSYHHESVISFAPEILNAAEILRSIAKEL
jgi:hypothetical protein